MCICWCLFVYLDVHVFVCFVWFRVLMELLSSLSSLFSLLFSLLSLSLYLTPCVQTIVTGAGDETLRFWNVFPSAASKEVS
jgi:WD40 repeat protein